VRDDEPAGAREATAFFCRGAGSGRRIMRVLRQSRPRLRPTPASPQRVSPATLWTTPDRPRASPRRATRQPKPRRPPPSPSRQPFPARQALEAEAEVPRGLATLLVQQVLVPLDEEQPGDGRFVRPPPSRARGRARGFSRVPPWRVGSLTSCPAQLPPCGTVVETVLLAREMTVDRAFATPAFLAIRGVVVS